MNTIMYINVSVLVHGIVLIQSLLGLTAVAWCFICGSTASWRNVLGRPLVIFPIYMCVVYLCACACVCLVGACAFAQYPGARLFRFQVQQRPASVSL